ncbi:MAG: hypothetical protein ABSH51_00030 [Solirubrobacteraceae bacterium]
MSSRQAHLSLLAWRHRLALGVLLAGVVALTLHASAATARGGRGAGVGSAAPAARSAQAPVSPPALTSPGVPQGFVGVDTDGPLFAFGTPVNLSQQFGAMVASGVESIRVAFNWALAQPYQSWSNVPADQQSYFTNVAGRPIDFQQTDEVVADAARAGMSVLPTVLYAPSWDAQPNPSGFAIPRQVGPYAAYLTALIQRYGPAGSFWVQNPGIPKVPIRRWQIWNEPNIGVYWPQPFAPSYVALLRAAHTAIKRADPGAQVVLGALTNFAWTSIGTIYAIPGARDLFDVVAVNGFTKQPSDVIQYMRFMRNALIHWKDGQKPLLATEVSWPSAAGVVTDGYDFDTTEAGQATNIAALLPLLGKYRTNLGLAGFYYYTWMSDEDPGALAFGYAGLLKLHDGQVTMKPALVAYAHAALTLEGCQQKGAVATACVRSAPAQRR